MQMVMSVLAAFFGVQSERNRQRDFQHGKPIYFIVAGIILTVLFILLVWGTVNLVLRAAGV